MTPARRILHIVGADDSVRPRNRRARRPRRAVYKEETMKKATFVMSCVILAVAAGNFVLSLIGLTHRAK